MNKLFSIVIPVYNGEQFIQETLDSIFAQTYRNYELIVVDGNSTDKTLHILYENKDRIDILISENDRGMYDALNKGFERARGDYFCYINADDRLLPEALEKVIQKFEEEDYDLVFGDVNFISETGDVIYSYRSINVGHKAIEYTQRLPFCQQSSFWTREVFFEKGGFDSTLKYVADSKFFFKVCLDPQTKKGHIPVPLGEFRLHSSSLSVGSSEEMEVETREMIDLMKLKKNIFLNVLYEIPLKAINFRQIIKKEFYRGSKLKRRSFSEWFG